MSSEWWSRRTFAAVLLGFQGWLNSRNSRKSVWTTDRNEAQENACMQRTKSRKYIISVLQAGRLMILKERRSAEAYLTKIKLLRVCTKDCTNPTELRTADWTRTSVILRSCRISWSAEVGVFPFSTQNSKFSNRERAERRRFQNQKKRSPTYVPLDDSAFIFNRRLT